MNLENKIRGNLLKIPNFNEFNFLVEVFLAQKIPPVFSVKDILYINKIWVYLLAVFIFKTEKLNIFCWESKRKRYFERLNPKRKKRRIQYRRAKRKLRRIVEESTPFSYIFEKSGSHRFILHLINKCIAYIVLKRMLFYFRRCKDGEKRAEKIYKYICEKYPKVSLLYPAKRNRRILERIDIFSGVMSTEKFEKLKNEHRFSNRRFLEGVLEYEERYKDSSFIDAKINQADSYYEEGFSDLQKEKNWKNVLLFREFKPENIECRVV